MHPGLGCFGGMEGQRMSGQPRSRACGEPAAPSQGLRVWGCSLVSPRGEVAQLKGTNPPCPTQLEAGHAKTQTGTEP